MMKHLLLVAACILCAGSPAGAQGVSIGRFALGSGEPGLGGFENAEVVENDIYHAPQYLPGHPTARSIWPRVILVSCQRTDGAVQCDGYNWSPGMGRAEYLFFKPVFAAAPAAR